MDRLPVGLHRSSTGEQVARELRDALVRGEIAPGSRLREVAIAELFRVSRNTVREALRILAVEGLVSHSLHRGVAVTELDDDEIAEVYRAKRALEVAGIAASEEAPTEWLDQLRAVSADIGRARSADQLAEADLAFHTHIVRAIQSRQLDEQYRNIQAQLRLTRAWTVRRRGGARQMYELHQEVVDALAAGDRDRASALLGAINDEGERRLREAIRDRARDDGMPKIWPATDAQSWRTVAATAVAGSGD